MFLCGVFGVMGVKRGLLGQSVLLAVAVLVVLAVTALAAATAAAPLGTHRTALQEADIFLQASISALETGGKLYRI